jgi:hypothetical protein
MLHTSRVTDPGEDSVHDNAVRRVLRRTDYTHGSLIRRTRQVITAGSFADCTYGKIGRD